MVLLGHLTAGIPSELLFHRQISHDEAVYP
jgi:hypothetical protein